MKSRTHYFIAFATVWASLANAGVNQWTTTGPVGGNTLSTYYLPTKSGTAVASTLFSLYRTTDNGVTWVSVASGAQSKAFAASPTNANRLLAAGSSPAVYFSNDAGVTFDTTSGPMLPAPGTEAIAYSANGQVIYLTTQSGDFLRSLDGGVSWNTMGRPVAATSVATLSDLAIAPNNQDIVYVPVQGSPTTGIFKTIDGGANWSALPFGYAQPRSISINPNNSNVILVAGLSNLARSIDGGANWAVLYYDPFLIVRFDPLVNDRAFAFDRWGKFYRSDDAGATWLLVANLPSVAAISLSFDTTTPGRLICGHSGGVLVSDDAGLHWQAANTGIYGGWIDSIVVNESSRSVFAASSNDLVGVYSRANNWNVLGFGTFQSALASLHQQEQQSGAYAIAVAPSNPNIMFASRILGLEKSIDGGATWTKPTTDFDSESVRAIAIHPSNPQIVYAGTSTQGVRRSSDGGATWSPRSTGLPNVIFHSIAISPNDPSVIYAGTRDPTTNAIFKTVDDGLTWSPANGGATIQRVFSIAINPTNAENVFVGADSGLYRTENGGAVWSKARSYGQFVAMDPASPHIVIADAEPTGMHGVVRSVDSGSAWEFIPFFPSGLSAGPMAFDPAKPNNLLVSTFTAGMRELEVATDLELTVPSSGLFVGSNKSVSFQIRNKGPYAASSVSLVIDTPAGVIDPTSLSRGCTLSGARVTCTVASIKTNEAAGFSMAATPTSVTDQITASVSAHESDLVSTNNTVVQTAKNVSDLDIRLTGPSTSIVEGNRTLYTSTITNLGPSPVTNLRASYQFSAGVTFDTVQGNGATCAAAALQLNCDIASIGDAGFFLIQFFATPTTPGELVTVASIPVISTDPVSANNSSTNTVAVQARSTSATPSTPSSPSTPSPSTPSSTTTTPSSGGGGAIQWWMLMSLAIASVVRRRILSPAPHYVRLPPVKGEVFQTSLP